MSNLLCAAEEEITMLEYLREEANITLTENGATTYISTKSHCLDLFASIGAIRKSPENDIIGRFVKALAENKDLALKTLFFARDAREGLGERRVFRVILNYLAKTEPGSVRKNIEYIAEYGRYDDLLCLIGTPCEKDALRIIEGQLKKDIESGGSVSLLAKWLPSVNASNKETVRTARRLARLLGMSEMQYRKTVVALRKKIDIVENRLRVQDYTFDYSKIPALAMLKYRGAFYENDFDRYCEYIDNVKNGKAKMHTGVLTPYDVIAPCFNWRLKELSAEERSAMDVTWNALEDFGNDENALAVIDGSGSMYPRAIAVALSLGIYFAERNKGKFRNHFITFSKRPQLVEIKGRDIVEKVRYCCQYGEVANTNISAVFKLLLKTAVKYDLPQEELPKRLYIISDMEFDECAENAGETNFECAKRKYAEKGYTLPEIVFWNVESRNNQQPVTMNENGVALVSGCSPRLFSMMASGELDPYKAMLDVLMSERYAKISA